MNENFCAQLYGPEFTLVNNYVVGGVRTWDPWFDVPNTNRKSPQLMYYEDPNGNEVVTNPTEEDYAVYDVVPPTYCQYPSPGSMAYNRNTGTWSLVSGFAAVGRMDNIATNERCTNAPGADGTLTRVVDRKLSPGAKTNQTRAHPRELTGRQGSSGGFLDPNVYLYMGCSATDNGDGDGEDPCDDDSDSCGNDATNVPTTNGANPTQDPLPAASYGGYSTGPITSLPSPTFVSCSTQNADPDNGIVEGYCVCSGSTFAQSTDAAITPVNYCAYTTPLPASTTSISRLPTGPTTTVITQPTPSNTFDVYLWECGVLDGGFDEFTVGPHDGDFCSTSGPANEISTSEDSVAPATGDSFTICGDGMTIGTIASNGNFAVKDSSGKTGTCTSLSLPDTTSSCTWSATSCAVLKKYACDAIVC